MKIWGYWATLGWGFLALIGSQCLAFALIWLLGVSNHDALFDGRFVALSILIANPIIVAIIALAVAAARASLADYLALIIPPPRYVGIGLASLVCLIAIFDASLYFSGYPLVTSFQLQSYTTAASEGWLLALWVGAVLFAPAGEEILFRGFLFRGWVRSPRAVGPAIIAIVVISFLWAIIHVQYELIYVLEIFFVGLFLGWMRYVSGSTLLTFLLHALFNVEGTLETVAQLHWASASI
jgi:uncharacterized protein